MKVEFLTSLLLLLSGAHAFLQDGLFPPKILPNANLPQFLDALTGHELKINLHLGDQLCVQNLNLKLDASSSDSKIPMPGFHGPHKTTSSGLSQLQILQKGHYINQSGLVHPDLDPHTSWELVWRDSAPAGYLVCGLHLLQDAHRNAAAWKQGICYLNFSVWTQQRLEEFRQKKDDLQRTITTLEDERDQALAQYRSATNWLAKAVHLRNAFAAVENVSLYRNTAYEQIPSPEDTLEIEPGMFVGRHGTIWRTEEQGWGTRNIPLGTATIRL